MKRFAARLAGSLLLPFGIATAQAACPLLPQDHALNTRIDHLPVDARSVAYVNSIGATTSLHADFGAGLWQGSPMGIPYVRVPGAPRVAMAFDYRDESDPGPYPIPANAPIEGGPTGTGDRHVLVVDESDCTLYELFDAHPQPDGSWKAGSGAVFPLGSNALRPNGWTSADAAGLPIVPTLASCEDIERGEIRHALRFTATRTQRKFVWPARHYASTITDLNVPPMGQRFRLKASFDTSRYSPQTRILLEAMQAYGLILADNGGNWYVSGATGGCWDNDHIYDELRTVKGSDFEAVDVSSMMIHPDSGSARTAGQVAHTLTTRATGGTGTLTSAPAGIDCGASCAASFMAGSTVTLTARAATGQAFVGWSGCAGVEGASCTVVMNGDQAATATFKPAGEPVYTLHVSKYSRGTVISTPAGIHCGPRYTCAANDAKFAAGTHITLTATPETGYVFKVWEGACTGTGACVVEMNGDRQVIARFRARRRSDP